MFFFFFFFFVSLELQASCNKFGQLTIGYLDSNFAYTQKINWYICSMVRAITLVDIKLCKMEKMCSFYTI